MCMWVRAMHKYHQVSVMVEPKKKLLAEATAELEETMQKLAEVPTQCVEVEVEVELELVGPSETKSRHGQVGKTGKRI